MTRLIGSWMPFIICAVLILPMTFSMRASATSDPVLVLRPESDYSTDWSEYPTSPATNWDKLDETTDGGDGYTSYVYTHYGGVTNGVYGMENASLAEAGGYSLVVWAIALRQGASGLQQIQLGVQIYIGGIGTPWYANYSLWFDMNSTFTNFTYSLDVNPYTGNPWTPSDLNNTYLRVHGEYASYPANAIIVSQVGMTVYASGEGPPPDEGEGGDESAIWSINVIGYLGLVGFCGMIAIPATGMYLYRRDGGGVGSGVSAAISVLVAWMICFTMFMAAVFG